MANIITIARFPLLILVVLVLYAEHPLVQLVAVPLMALLIALDTIDGVVARHRREVSALGSVLDIMADRTIELVLWICYADLRLVPVMIPIIFVIRGTVVDSLRGFTVGAGQAPFSAMRTRVGRWLVVSPFMRTPYGLAKLASFAGLALTRSLMIYAGRGAVSPGTAQASLVVFSITSWIAVAFCLARGVPVVVEALPALSRQGSTPQRGNP
jgi:CDP-diacylglycerol--glycerol-3-phosphate 3-phosphatidyltransferase